jgi:ATP-dependent DNA helicase RecG
MKMLGMKQTWTHSKQLLHYWALAALLVPFLTSCQEQIQATDPTIYYRYDLPFRVNGELFGGIAMPPASSGYKISLSSSSELSLIQLNNCHRDHTRQVKTKIVEEQDALIDYAIMAALEKQKRVYVVAPKIMESSSGKQSVVTLYQHYAKKYPKKVSLLHGKLDAEEKEDALVKFSTGYTPIIVSTTVIEVGIDVKPATVMIIHDADTFGLASLHQLRGRIGRDGSEALCLLVIQDLHVEGIERLQVLVHSNDGFYIAEQDLQLRGPGELMGSKQSGLPGFQYLNIVKDFSILQKVKKLLTQEI